jgi:ATP-dependent DNA helicase RecQ
MTALHEIQRLIHTGEAENDGDPFLRRLAAALKAKAETERPSPADLAGLLRQGILRAELLNDQARELHVPHNKDWPTPQLWERFSCEATPVRPGYLRVRPRQWTPEWLDHGVDAVVAAAIREEARRRQRDVPADPALTEQLGWSTYSSPGQREAIRAAFLTQAGTTTIVNLPTGGGKSLSFQLPALTWRTDGGLALVIVPTVALARDQEARFRALLAQAHAAPPNVPLAYHSGLDEGSRLAIRTAIRTGEAPIVFASPEAAVGALRDPLFSAARQGRLRLFAVDEAHLIAQWGDQFRPEFQSLAGLRDALLAACPANARFRTLLLSATLTAEALDALRALFGQDRCELVCELALRNEISFLLSRARDEMVRIAQVAAALDHLPRPLILYTTLREHAQQWYFRLRASGYSRVRLVRGGDLSDENGVRILDEWRSGSIDIVVATSAFGLGMDQSEVRSVIHACLPETIDRYYQEVGRAGRDGNAAVALLVSAPEDARIARDLAEKQRISVDRGFERWQSMWFARRVERNGTYVLRLDCSPADITSPGERNEAWNMRTLVLMARAKLIAFTAHEAPHIQQADGEEPEKFEARRRLAYERYSLEVSVQLLDQRHNDISHWNTVVSTVRAQLRDQDRAASALAAEIQDLRRPLNDVFRDAYHLSDPPVRPSRLMGSCPISRARGNVDFFVVDPELISFTRTDVVPSAQLLRVLGPCIDAGRRAWIAYSPVMGDPLERRAWRNETLLLLQYFVSQGVMELCVPDYLCDTRDWSRLVRQSDARFLVRSNVVGSNATSVGARVTVLDADCDSQTVDHVITLRRSLHIIILPQDAPDPSRPRQRLLSRALSLTTAEIKMRLDH